MTNKTKTKHKKSIAKKVENLGAKHRQALDKVIHKLKEDFKL